MKNENTQPRTTSLAWLSSYKIVKIALLRRAGDLQSPAQGGNDDKGLLATQGTVRQVTAAVFLWQQAGRFGAGGGDVLEEFSIRVVHIEQFHDIHILDSNVILGADIDGSFGPFEAHTFPNSNQGIGAGIPIGCFQTFDKHQGSVETICIE